MFLGNLFKFVSVFVCIGMLSAAAAQEKCYFGDGQCGEAQTDCKIVPNSQLGFQVHRFQISGDSVDKIIATIRWEKGQQGSESTARLSYAGYRCDNDATSLAGTVSLTLECLNLGGGDVAEIVKFGGTLTSASKVELCARGVNIRVGESASSN